MELILLALIVALLVVILVIQLRKGNGSADLGVISSRMEQIDVSQQKQGASPSVRDSELLVSLNCETGASRDWIPRLSIPRAKF